MSDPQTETRDILDDLERLAHALRQQGYDDGIWSSVDRAAAEIRRLRTTDIKPVASALPVEQMRKDASRRLKQAEKFPGGCSELCSDLACHVLALLEENERLRAELAALREMIN